MGYESRLQSLFERGDVDSKMDPALRPDATAFVNAMEDVVEAQDVVLPNH